MLDILIALAFVTIIPLAYYGVRVLVVVLIAVVSSVMCEQVFCLLLRKKSTIPDLSAIVYGYMIALLLPAGAPYWMPALGAVFAIVVAKMPFGGTGRNIFNPAAAGVAFLTLSFTQYMFAYPAPFTYLKVFKAQQFNTAISPDAVLAGGGKPDYLSLEWLLGNYAGPMGATAVLVIAACGVYLIYRKVITFHIPLSFIATCALVALVFPRLDTGAVDSLVAELFSGSLVFVAVFIASDTVTSPKHPAAKLVYGILAGLICMLYRHFGKYQQGAVFSVLLVNTISEALDKAAWHIIRKRGVGQ